MIPNGTRVEVSITGYGEKALITLLNSIGGTVVKELDTREERTGYLIAYDEDKLPEIDAAVKLDADNGLGIMFFSILGKMRPKEFPGDKRYYLLAFANELKPI